MGQNSFLKDLVRTIYKTKARFFSILAIIAIGVGFFAGINATQPDMLLSAEKYFKEHNLSDFKIISPLGFREQDLEEISKIRGVKDIQWGYSKDVFLNFGGATSSIVKIFSFDADDFIDSKGQNIPLIREGRMPQRPGEMAIEYGINVPKELKIGSKVDLYLPEGENIKNYIKSREFTITGIIDSPLYINLERGQTNIGNGSIDFFAYIIEKDFNMDRYNDVFISTNESKNLSPYSNEYKEYIASIKKPLEDLGKRAIEEETGELKEELKKGMEELKRNKEKAERELAKGEKELLDGQREIEEGEEELAEARIKYIKELEDGRLELEKGKKDWEKGREAYLENYEKWLEGYAEYNQGVEKLNNAKLQLDKAKIELDQGEMELQEAKAMLDEGKNQLDILEESIVQLKNLRQIIVDGPSLSQEEFNGIVDNIDGLPKEVKVALKESYKYIVENPEGVLVVLNMTISRLEEELASGKKEYEKGKKEFEDGLRKLNEGKELYKTSLKEYEAGLRELRAAKVEIDKGKSELDRAKTLLSENNFKITQGEKELEQGRIELEKSLEEGQEKLIEARGELSKGWSIYNKEKEEALEKLREAEIDIRDAQRKIKEIPEGWFVIDREGNPGYGDYNDDAERIGAVAKVFPLFFFLVAALVCLTTMTRMIEEERSQIGTMKALGYNTLAISSKYLIYALLSSLVGALVGLAIGFKLFPIAIMNAYGIMYRIPERIAIYHYDYGIISILLAVFTTVSSSLLATLQELKSTPAMLLQPKAPRPGKRILMERITPLWKRLSFSHKVTARNIFRYKRRFFMTVIGIAGCTALLLAGFGIKDSIDILDVQFGEIFTYDGQIILDTNKEEGKRDLEEILGKEREVDSYIRALNQSVEALVKDSDRSYNVNLLVPENTEDFKEFFDLHERVTKKTLDLNSKGVIITEKLAELLKIKLGDSFEFRDTDNIRYEVEVKGIAENYLSHYIYMSPEYYDNIVLKDPLYNGGIFTVKDINNLDKNNFKEKLMAHEGVLATFFIDGIAKEVHYSMDSLDYVIMIIVLSAGALAFLVLYNLTNINITERIREIATIKVLGFRDKEVASYVYRENLILTLIGTFVGLILGVFFHKYIIATMEIDEMMFGKNISLLSYILSIVLTIIFSILVNIFMYHKLKNVNMVESLKSIE